MKCLRLAALALALIPQKGVAIESAARAVDSPFGAFSAGWSNVLSGPAAAGDSNAFYRMAPVIIALKNKGISLSDFKKMDAPERAAAIEQARPVAVALV